MIVFLAHDPGGADCVVPLFETMQTHITAVCLYLVGPAAQKYTTYATTEHDVRTHIDALIQSENLHCLVTGTSWGSTFEVEMLQRCYAHARTIALIDFWSNYKKRFLGREAQHHFPHVIIVPDAKAQHDARVDIGDVDVEIIALGHPGLAQLALQKIQQPCYDDALLFLSQPILSFYGQSFGFTEYDVMDSLIRVTQRLGYTLHVRFHPKDADHYKETYAQYALDGPFRESIAAHRYIVGVNTMAMLHSTILGRPAISYQPHLIGPDACVFNALGYTTLITDEATLMHCLQHKQVAPLTIPIIDDEVCTRIVNYIMQYVQQT